MKSIFNTLRKLSGGRLSQSQVDAGNHIADKLGKEPLAQLLNVATATASTNTPIATPMQLSKQGLTLIAQFEGFRPKPYLDAVGVPTIGYGNTYYLDGRKVKMTDKPISRDEALQLKLDIINKDFAPVVNRLLEKEIKSGQITQNMFDALISLAYNIGIGNLSKSSVIRHLKAGNKQQAGDAFLMWNKAKGRVLNGLVRRRKREREVFLA